MRDKDPSERCITLEANVWLHILFQLCMLPDYTDPNFEHLASEIWPTEKRIVWNFHDKFMPCSLKFHNMAWGWKDDLIKPIEIESIRSLVDDWYDEMACVKKPLSTWCSPSIWSSRLNCRQCLTTSCQVSLHLSICTWAIQVLNT